MTDKTKLIAQQNDQCRQMVQMPVFGEPVVSCKIMLTEGISSLSPEDQILVCAKVRQFDDFSEHNNPYGERDFGALDHKGNKIFWKIDYYDPSLKWGSDDPSDLSKTVRVLTIMLASEY